MSGKAGEPAMEDSTALLERALGYALCSVRHVTGPALGSPTPCAEWDLRALLWHAADSLAALYEGVRDGHVAPTPDEGCDERDGCDGPPVPDCSPGGIPGDPVAAFHARAARLLEAWGAGDGGRTVTVGDLPLPAGALARAGALEIAVHGWDVARSTGRPRHVPVALASELLGTARQLLPEPAARQPLFEPPVPVPAEAGPSDRLVAFLGRDPYASAPYGTPGDGGTGRGRGERRE